MRARQIDTDSPRDVRRFIEFPLALYRGCPQFVPPLETSARLALDRRHHPYFAHSEAAFFLVEEGHRVLGRIAAMHNRLHNEYRGVKTAFFGFFDAVDDTAVSRALFDAAFEWARGRGRKDILGPRGLVGPDTIGVLVEGFEHRAVMGVSYNYPYYERLVLDASFERELDSLSGYLPGDYHLPPRLSEIAEKVKARRGLWVKGFASREEMRPWVLRVTRVYEEAFRDLPEFFPLSEGELRLMADDLISAADPRLLKLVMKGDDVAGFVFAYPDVAVALQRTRGRLFPLGWLWLLREQRRSEWAVVNGIGLLPAYRGVGGDVLLLTELERSLRARAFKHVDAVMVGEDNDASRANLEKLGVRWYKRHRSYRRRL